jgi:lipopolysaccharide transport system ATP-binding protein
MEQTVLEVEHVGKMYRLGDIGAGSLKEEAHRWWDRVVRGKTDAGADAGENDLSGSADEKAFWALRDISFRVRQGEVLGIIGKNGAGKSTLLKILSRISRPTCGTITGRGRVASMLEVGTGFHQELTGRENIFLNGNILGMGNREIRAKLDAIIDFSGIHKFIDTPVKRYSSGMYVRLAFAVAAHLDPDILILDEVLSVGDTEFQEKCLAKMQEIVSSQGCTILYVSHNMHSIMQLCHRAILLKQGRMACEGAPTDVVSAYYNLLGKRQLHQSWEPAKAPGNGSIRMSKVKLQPAFAGGQQHIDVRTALDIRFEFLSLSPDLDLSIGIHLFTAWDECIFDISSPSSVLAAGKYEGCCRIPGNFLNDGEYYISIIFSAASGQQLLYLQKCLVFDVADYRDGGGWKGKSMGYVRPLFPVHITKSKVDA